MTTSKRLLMVGVLALSGLILAGCTPRVNVQTNPNQSQPTVTPPSETGQQPESQTSTPPVATTTASTTAGVSVDTGSAAVKEFKITAEQWEFSPATITVNQGDRVRLVVTSPDVDHGIAIAEYGINQIVPKGETKTVEFTADKSGTFTFYCSVRCGSGHGSMRGQLIVK